MATELSVHDDESVSPDHVVSSDDDEFGNLELSNSYELKPHQYETISWMLQREEKEVYGIKGGILALGMGTGKTIISVASCNCAFKSFLYRRFPNLIVCPKMLVSTWEEEIRKFFGNNCKYFVFYNERFRPKTLFDQVTFGDLDGHELVI